MLIIAVIQGAKMEKLLFNTSPILIFGHYWIKTQFFISLVKCISILLVFPK